MNANLTETQVLRLRRVAQGRGADAFAAIVRLYGGMVYHTGLRITGDAGCAADVAQETFFHLFKNAGRITGSLSGWLHQVAPRRAIDRVRRDSSRRRREQAYAAQAPRETDSWADISPLVDEALSELDEESRELIVRHYLSGERMVDLATALGVSQPTISRRVEQALLSLRERLRLKGVLVAAGVLGGLLLSTTASAVPVPVMVELGKMSALSAGAATATTKGFLGVLTLKVAAVALVTAGGVGGYMAYESAHPPPPPPAPVTAPAGATVRPPGGAGVPAAPAAPRRGAALRGTTIPDKPPGATTRTNRVAVPAARP